MPAGASHCLAVINHYPHKQMLQLPQSVAFPQIEVEHQVIKCSGAPAPGAAYEAAAAGQSGSAEMMNCSVKRKDAIIRVQRTQSRSPGKDIFLAGLRCFATLPYA